MRHLLSLLRPHARKISAAIGCLLVSSTITMSVPAWMGTLIDYAVNQENFEQVTQLCLALGGVFALGAMANCGRIYLLHTTGERVVTEIRRRLFHRLVRQEMGFFDGTRTAELINRLSSDAYVMGRNLTDNVSDGLRSVAQCAGGLGMMFYLSPMLSLITLAIIPPISLSGIIYGRFVKKLSRQVQDALSKTTEVAEERLSQIRVVRSFGREEMETERYVNRVMDVFQLAKKSVVASASFFGFAGFGGNIMILSILWYGGSLVMSGAMTVGSLTSFLLYATYVGFSVMGLSSFYSNMMRSLGASGRVFELMERTPQITEDGSKRPEQIQGDIEFSNLHFRYPTRTETPIFQDLNLRVEAGQVMAIVGPSGSGKSTLAWLLLRFYDPEQGSITIDGTPVSEYDTNWLREHVGVVLQEPVLFADSIAENIRYGKPDATDQEVRDAARMANAEQFVNRFPDGYDTLVGERGVALSGGQKQRIAIARTIINNPKILILDEATSALDTESERLVQEAMERMMKGRTVLVITHRLSTVRHADLVTVLDGGRVAEKGTHTELMNNENGLFRQLVKQQMMEF